MLVSRRLMLTGTAATALATMLQTVPVHAGPPLTLDQAIGRIGAVRLRELLGHKLVMDGHGAMWAGRIEAVMSFGVDVAYRRGNPGLHEILKCTTFDAYVDASRSTDLDPLMLRRVRSTLSSIPGYDEEKGYRQAISTLDQFGFIEISYHRVLGLLAVGGGTIAQDVLSGAVDWEDLERRSISNPSFPFLRSITERTQI